MYLSKYFVSIKSLFSISSFKSIYIYIYISQDDINACYQCMMLPVGIEPTRSTNPRILSPVRLPVPPQQQRRVVSPSNRYFYLVLLYTALRVDVAHLYILCLVAHLRGFYLFSTLSSSFYIYLSCLFIRALLG